MKISKASGPTSIENLARLQAGLQHSAARLASGEKQLADDPAGQGVSDRLRALIDSYETASRNVADGQSLVRAADGALDEVGDIVGRMRELAVQSANGTLSDADRQSLQTEFGELRDEVDRIAGSTSFNGTALLDGSTESVPLQAGTEAEDSVELELASVTSSDLGLDELDLSTAAGAGEAIASLDGAIVDVADARGAFGTADNHLSSVSRSLGQARADLSASESRIRDVDYALEASRFFAQRVQQEAAAAVFVQGNVSSSVASSLLGQ